MPKSDKTITRGVLNFLGARTYSINNRAEDDFYQTPPIAVEKLLANYQLPETVWECACGTGSISKEFEKKGFTVISSDIRDRGYGYVKDFFEVRNMPEQCRCIVTNPPYNVATEFIVHALDIVGDDGVVVMLLKTQFLETKKRYEQIFRDNCPEYIFQFVKRISCLRGESECENGAAMPFAWFVWDRCERSRRKKMNESIDTRVRWI